jgi:uncharacterized repeat protein (TIGR01451 family)
MSVYEYGSDASGLHFTINAIVANGNTTFTVDVLTGSLNLNALYWSDGDAVAAESTRTGFTGAQSESSLAMNGANVVWADTGTSTSAMELYDGGIKLSDAGLGPVPPPTYLNADSAPYSFTVNGLNITKFDILGVRATSTSTEGGSIKWVDDCPVESKPSLTVDKQLLDVNGNASEEANSVGDVLHYSITVTNTGNVALTDVSIVDPLTGQNITGVSVGVGESKVFNSNYAITQADLDGAGNAGADHDIDNTATVDSKETTPVTDSTHTPLVYNPELAIQKQFVDVNGHAGEVANSVGDVLHYTVTVQNTGNVTLTGVTVVDPLTGQNVSGVTLAPGASQSFNSSYAITQADLDGAGNAGADHDIDNVATADSNQTAPKYSNNVEVPIVSQHPALTIDKELVNVNGHVGEEANSVGDVLNYSVTIKNTGDVALTGVTVVDPLTGQNIVGVALAVGETKV